MHMPPGKRSHGEQNRAPHPDTAASSGIRWRHAGHLAAANRLLRAARCPGPLPFRSLEADFVLLVQASEVGLYVQVAGDGGYAADGLLQVLPLL